MSFMRKHAKLIGVAASCAAIGAGASAIASAGAAPGANAHAGGAKAAHARMRLRRVLARAVHGDAVVPTKSGFATVTFDRGVVVSVNGQQLTLREGTKTATYKTVTLTIPANARVRDDRQSATLANLKPGQRAVVLQAPKRTLVIAHDAKTP